MAKTIIYIHGKGGNAEEAIHYKPLFGNCDVIGFDYESQTPWEAGKNFRNSLTRSAGMLSLWKSLPTA